MPKPDLKTRALAKLKTMQDEVDPRSYQRAQTMLTLLIQAGVTPGRIVATADRLVAIWFSEGLLKMRIEACEDGEFVLSKGPRDGGAAMTHTEYASAHELMRGLDNHDKGCFMCDHTMSELESGDRVDDYGNPSQLDRFDCLKCRTIFVEVDVHVG